MASFPVLYRRSQYAPLPRLQATIVVMEDWNEAKHFYVPSSLMPSTKLHLGTLLDRFELLLLRNC